MEFNSNSFVPIPCKRECPMRTETCHGDCEAYKHYMDFKAWQRTQRTRTPATDYSIERTMRGKNNYYRRRRK